MQIRVNPRPQAGNTMSDRRRLHRADRLLFACTLIVVAIWAGAGAVTSFAASARSGHMPNPTRTGTSAPRATWDARAAASYLDARQTWWLGWRTAARDHETSCVSCHTAVPYALARPALRAELHETAESAPEHKLLENVIKRVRLWNEVKPFYPDQTVGLPKSSESRGTEAVLNALILAMRDAREGKASDDARAAFDNLWALQFRTGGLNGAWAWLNFHLEPWESDDAAYFGATLAAIAVGTEPDGYAAKPEIQDGLKLLREHLQRTAGSQRLFNRVFLLWASARLSDLLSAAERQSIIDAIWTRQLSDGGWSLPALGQWKRNDGTALDTLSDGYATGVITLALQQAGISSADPRVAKALAWLAQHQDPASGKWSASSLNKQRDPSSDTGKFMSDAATAFAVLALTQGGASPRAP
jgi:squalene-hopene/tetraprenyl-beta-curcumene cyclase